MPQSTESVFHDEACALPTRLPGVSTACTDMLVLYSSGDISERRFHASTEIVRTIGEPDRTLKQA
jgi:hypothetical protein